MKKIITLIVSFGVVLLVAYLSINLYTNSKLNHVKQRVIEINPDVTGVEAINSNGKWGEWFSEYILVVEINGLKYRIWTSDKGEITDKEPF